MTIASPNDIAKVVGWYSADHLDSLGMSDGAVISTWEDLSPAGNDMVLTGGPTGPKFRSAGGPAGGPSVQFPGGSAGYFTLPNVWGAEAVFGVGQPSGELYGYIISEHDGTDPYPGPWMFGYYSSSYVCHYPFSPGGASNIYEHFGLGGSNRPNGQAAVSLTAWRRINMWSDQFNWGLRLDDATPSGAQAWQTNTTFPDVRWNPAPLVGINIAGGQRARMRLGVLILTDEILTSGERSDLAAWVTANPSGGVLADPPGVPTSVVADPGALEVELTWGVPATGGDPDGYEVRLDGGSPTDVGDVLTHTFTSLTPATAYEVSVRAYNGGGESAWVDVDTETTLTGPEVAYAALIRVGSHTWDIEYGDPAEAEAPEVLAGATFAWSAPDTIGWPPPMYLVPRDVVRLKLRSPQAEDVADIRRGDVVRFKFTPEGFDYSDPLVDFAGVVTSDPQITDDPQGGVFLTVTASDHRVVFADWTIATGGTTHIGDGGDTKEVLLQNLSDILDTQAAAHVPGDFGDLTAGAVDPYEHLGYNLGPVDLEYTGPVTALKVLADIGMMPVPRYDDETGDLDPVQPFGIVEVDYFGRDFDTPDPVPASLVPNPSVEWRRDFVTTYAQVLEDLLGLPFIAWAGSTSGAPAPTDLRDQVVTRVPTLFGFETNGLSNQVAEPSPWTLYSFLVRAWENPEAVRDWFVYPHRVRQYVTIETIEELKHPGGTDTLSGTLKGAVLNIGARGRFMVQAGLRPHGFDPTYVSPGDP